MTNPVETICPVSCALLAKANGGLKHAPPPSADVEGFIGWLSALAERAAIPGYLPDLARVERAFYEQLASPPEPTAGMTPDAIAINPTLRLFEVGWQSLLQMLDGDPVDPAPGAQVLLFWRAPLDGAPCQSAASPEELLALKIVAEQHDPFDIAVAHNQPVGRIDGVIDNAVRKGLLMAPASKLRRELSAPTIPESVSKDNLEAQVFTLQWHITHRCDLHCRHCYDRSDRKDVALAQGLMVLDQMRLFCRDHHVAGQVSFSGGNPFLHPDFPKLYQAAHDRNLNLAILGNPVSEAQLDALLRIAKPSFFQVSLEGLEAHNDLIRGQGSYRAALDFLTLLRKKQVFSMVMLTLTRANLDQVVPLAAILRNRVDLFTYNRLAMVGEGASLESPRPDEYRRFVIDYLKARRINPIMALKDNLINIELAEQQQRQFGGCTGFGCGAAFNFVSLLPDGQVHACRKFPSRIGDMSRQSLSEIYHSPAARRYRQGCTACSTCSLRRVCGGCPAVTYGWQRDPLREKDPDCFLR